LVLGSLLGVVAMTLPGSAASDCKPGFEFISDGNATSGECMPAAKRLVTIDVVSDPN